MISPDFSVEVPSELGKVHFIGIGGSGMSGLARLLLKSGHRVTGSDVRGSGNVDSLIELGAEISIGHDANNLKDADTVVVTGALWHDNPEYQKALQLGLPVLHRAVLLSALASSKKTNRCSRGTWQNNYNRNDYLCFESPRRRPKLCQWRSHSRIRTKQ